jgi:hypothetical protein
MNPKHVNTEGAEGLTPTRRPWTRWSGAPAALLVVAVVVAGCGGGSPRSSGVAGLAHTTTTASASGSSGSAGGSGRSLGLEYSQCMRAHGVTNFPDPPQGSNGPPKLQPNSGIDTNSSSYQAAEVACLQYNQPYIQGASLTPAQRAAAQARLLRYAQCMRSHGDSSFPDPTLDPATGVARLSLSGHDRDTPAYQAANQACQSLFPAPPSGVTDPNRS